jgi:flavin reductase (DIM6/NTAB) family NADH-FMN oxidoreductase RutF
MAISEESFRDLLGRFPSGVTVVTATDGFGRPHGMTVSAFCSVSLRPPLVLVCIDRAASMFDLLASGRPFAVNLLAANQASLSTRFAQLDAETRFDGVGYALGVLGVPLLHGVHATLECRVAARHDAGDHGIFVGQVEDGVAGSHAPLVYHRGVYRQFRYS